jgi:hypothetical protein
MFQAASDTALLTRITFSHGNGRASSINSCWSGSKLLTGEPGLDEVQDARSGAVTSGWAQ